MPLCGNSIGTDRRFLAAYLPEIEEYLHYRSVDVSSLKELVRRWHPDVLTQRGWKAGTHRALDDIRESVSELRLYRELVFCTPDTVAERLAALRAAEAAARRRNPPPTRHDPGGGVQSVARARPSCSRCWASSQPGAGTTGATSRDPSSPLPPTTTTSTTLPPDVVANTVDVATP